MKNDGLKKMMYLCTKFCVRKQMLGKGSLSLQLRI